MAVSIARLLMMAAVVPWRQWWKEQRSKGQLGGRSSCEHCTAFALKIVDRISHMRSLKDMQCVSASWQYKKT